MAFVGVVLSGCIAYAEGSGIATVPEGTLVSAEWMEKNLDNPNVRVIEVSVIPGVYERGHIPHAQ